ncbi:hypothetical protein RRG08_044057 [Elysia crispata]|uniref:Uncharacterized protein n=1 Tax=Elysia crispata TaxID=231223 RepID=A0AAE0Y1D2_9GAST|nr:hypothetical protein RRG08_044057 [Elysia crispata]
MAVSASHIDSSLLVTSGQLVGGKDSGGQAMSKVFTARLAMNIILLALIFALIEATYSLTKHIELSFEDKLIKKLVARYKRRGKWGRPLQHYNETITIYYNMQLIQIMDLDERNQVLTLNVWDRYIWYDMHIKWDPQEFGGVDTIRIPSNKIWIPDIKLYNYADERLAERRDVLCVIKNDGRVLWMPQAIYKSSCEIDVQAFPFDIQSCKLKFGSWTYGGDMVDLMVLINVTGYTNGSIDMTEYRKSNSWEILEVPAVRNCQYYTCCPDEPYIDLSFTIIFQRRSAFYNYILILPCILLTSLTLVLFWIPPESPAKLMLGINIFVAFFLLLLLMEANLPPSAANVPLLGTYYCLNMVLITLSSFLNTFVVNLSFYGARRPLPGCMRKKRQERRCNLRTAGGAASQTLECNSFVLVYIHLEELYFLNTNNNISYAKLMVRSTWEEERAMYTSVPDDCYHKTGNNHQLTKVLSLAQPAALTMVDIDTPMLVAYLVLAARVL